MQSLELENLNIIVAGNGFMAKQEFGAFFAVAVATLICIITNHKLHSQLCSVVVSIYFLALTMLQNIAYINKLVFFFYFQVSQHIQNWDLGHIRGTLDH